MTTTALFAANDNVREFYVYQHRRNDTGEIFYIGKGRHSAKNDRAKTTHGRNGHWTNIVNKYGYTIEIVCDRLDEEFAFLLECELISKIGRRDQKTGPLVNLTGGGEGAGGVVQSVDTRKRISEAKLGWTPSAQTLKRMSIAQTDRVIGDRHRARMTAGIHLSGPHTDSATGYKGVSLHKKTGKWVARIKTDKKRHIGLYLTADDAARAYDAAAIEFWGIGNCYLNNPDQRYEKVA